MDSEKEIMSETKECLFEHSSCETLTSQTMTQNDEQPEIHLQYANLLLEDPTSWESSWTNEKHSLYLNSIEEAFVSSLYQQGYYKYPCKRWQADRGETSSVFSLDLNEEVESGFSDGQAQFGFPEESQSESEKPSIYSDVQNHSKNCRLKEICGRNNTFQEQNRNGKRNKRKLLHEVADPDREITNAFEEVQSKHNDERESNLYAGEDRFTQNTIVSETLMVTFSNNQKDQVVPSIDETSPKEDGKP